MNSGCTYPAIDRSKVDFRNPDEKNIGCAEGKLSDGRPYRMECWAIDQINCLTIFISNIGLELYSPRQVMKYLEDEGLFWRLANDFYGSADIYTDSNGNKFWAANLVVGVEDETYIDSVPLKKWGTQFTR